MLEQLNKAFADIEKLKENYGIPLLNYSKKIMLSSMPTYKFFGDEWHFGGSSTNRLVVTINCTGKITIPALLTSCSVKINDKDCSSIPVITSTYRKSNSLSTHVSTSTQLKTYSGISFYVQKGDVVEIIQYYPIVDDVGDIRSAYINPVKQPSFT